MRSVIISEDKFKPACEWIASRWIISGYPVHVKDAIHFVELNRSQGLRIAYQKVYRDPSRYSAFSCQFIFADENEALEFKLVWG